MYNNNGIVKISYLSYNYLGKRIYVNKYVIKKKIIFVYNLIFVLHYT